MGLQRLIELVELLNTRIRPRTTDEPLPAGPGRSVPSSIPMVMTNEILPPSIMVQNF